MKGDKLWTAEEDELLRKLYPDYQAIVAALPKRTYFACRARCRTLKLVTTRHVWTGADRMRLRRIYPTASDEELATVFPGRTLSSVQNIANRFGIFRKRRPYKLTGVAELDDLRGKCFEIRIKMPELDDISGIPNYFQKANWGGRRRPNYNAIMRAIVALDGKIKIEWSD